MAQIASIMDKAIHLHSDQLASFFQSIVLASADAECHTPYMQQRSITKHEHRFGSSSSILVDMLLQSHSFTQSTHFLLLTLK